MRSVWNRTRPPVAPPLSLAATRATAGEHVIEIRLCGWTLRAWMKSRVMRRLLRNYVTCNGSWAQCPIVRRLLRTGWAVERTLPLPPKPSTSR
jgi:hypothetical protein